MATSVNPAISSTSQPVQMGFSIGGGAVGIGVRITSRIESTEKASGAIGAGVNGCGSALTTGCGSNCGLSEDDKNLSLRESIWSSAVSRPRVFGIGPCLQHCARILHGRLPGLAPAELSEIRHSG